MTDRTPTEPTPESERDFLMWAIDCLMEINPSNYDHDDVCAMNSASVEVSLAMQARLSALAASPAAPGAEVAEAIHAARGFDPRDKSISGAGVPYGEWASTLKIAAAVAPFITGPGAEVQPVAFNINETVLVRLNDHGREIVRESDAKWSELYPRLRGHSTLPEEDADGWSKWQLWHLMKTFGPHMFAGAPNPFDITIRIPLPTTTDAIRAQARREALEGAMAAALSRKTEWARKAAEPGRSDHDVAVFESAASAADEIHEDIQRLAGKGAAE